MEDGDILADILGGDDDLMLSDDDEPDVRGGELSRGPAYRYKAEVDQEDAGKPMEIEKDKVEKEPNTSGVQDVHAEARPGPQQGGSYFGNGVFVDVQGGSRGRRSVYRDLDAPPEPSVSYHSPVGPNQRRENKKRKGNKKHREGQSKEVQAARQIFQFVQNAAERLKEPPAKRTLLRLAIEHLGTDTAKTMLTEVDSIEASGGMLTEDKKRRRTPGGVFWKLVQQKVEPEVYKQFLKAEKDEQKKRKAMFLEKNKAASEGATDKKRRRTSTDEPK